MAKKPTITAGFTTKSNFQSLPGVPVSQKLDSQLEWNPSIQSIVESITENYDRLVLNWNADVVDNQTIGLGQYVDNSNIIYRCTTSYSVGTPKTFTLANYQEVGGGGVALVDGIGTKFNVDRIDLEDLDLSSEIRISTPEISGVARKGIKYWLDPVNSSVKLQAFEYDGALLDREVADHSAYIDSNGDAIAEMWAVRIKTGGHSAMIRAHLGYITVGDLWSGGETGSFKGLAYHSYYDAKVDWDNNDLLVPHQKRVRDMWLNSPIPFTPTFALNEKQEFKDYTLSANETWNASSVKGGFAIFDLITDGTFTVSEGTGFYVDYNNFFGNVLPADTYRVQMIATSKGVDIQVISTGGAFGSSYIPYNIPNIIP